MKKYLLALFILTALFVIGNVALAGNNNPNLNVLGSGTGNGTVTSSDGHISCVVTSGVLSGVCNYTYTGNFSGVVLTPVASIGSNFVSWGGGCTGAGLCSAAANGNQTFGVTVNFNLSPVTQYTLTYLAGANGTLTGSTTQAVEQGANGTAVTAVANSGYHFVNWSDASTDNPRTDTNVQADNSYTANFESDPNPMVQFILTYLSGIGGTISGSSTQIIDQGSDGSQVTAVPDSGYHFTNWSDGTTTTSRTDLNIQASATTTANFAADPTGGSSLTINTSINNNFVDAYGTAHSQSADLDQNWTVSLDWGDGSSTTTGILISEIVQKDGVWATTTHLYSLAGSYTINAFLLKNTNIEATSSTVININLPPTDDRAPIISGTPEDITRSTTSTSTVVTYDLPTAYDDFEATSTLVVCNPASGSLFTAGTTTPVTCTTTDSSDNTATSTFNVTVIHTETTDTTPPIISGTPGTTYATTTGTSTVVTYTEPTAYDDVVGTTTVTCLPASGSLFDVGTTTVTCTSSDGLNTATSTFDVIVNSTPEQLAQFTLVYLAGANGTLTGSTTQTVEQGANGTAVTAVANSGYHFVNWSDSSTTNPRTDLNVQANATTTANFAENQSSGGGSTGGHSSGGSSGSTGSAGTTGGSTDDLINLLGLMAFLEAQNQAGNIPAPVPAVGEEITAPATGGEVTGQGTTTEEVAGATTTEEGNLPLAAAVGTASGFGFSWWWVLAIIVIAGILYYIYRRGRSE